MNNETFDLDFLCEAIIIVNAHTAFNINSFYNVESFRTPTDTWNDRKMLVSFLKYDLFFKHNERNFHSPRKHKSVFLQNVCNEIYCGLISQHMVIPEEHPVPSIYMCWYAVLTFNSCKGWLVVLQRLVDSLPRAR